MSGEERRREAATRYAWSMIGLPYLWGGDDPIKGFDCSGFVIEVLTGVGILPHRYDGTAHSLFLNFRDCPCVPGRGALAFWFKGGVAVHVEMMVDELHVIGASGGGSSTKDEDAAVAANAFVKMRPLGYRGEAFVLVDPFAGGAP